MTTSKEKHIWVLSELYYPEDSATGHNITKVAEGLAASYNVSVLCSQPTYQARGTKAPSDEVRNNVRVHRCRATTLNKDVLAFRLVNLLTISVSIFFNALMKIQRGDLVLVVTNPPTLPFVVVIACRIRGAKIVLRVEDVYPDALVATGMAKANSLLVRAFSVLQRRLYSRVDQIVVLGRDMMRLVESKMIDNDTPVILITNFADSDQIAPMPRESNSLLQKLGIIDKFVIQYSGNMGRTHGIESLVQCARLLHLQEHIHFLFIGFGAKESWLKKTVRDLALGNVTVLPLQPRSDLILSLNACDLAVISFINGMSGVSVPCRMYNIMSAGKPILAVSDRESELSQVVAEENIGWVVKPEVPDLIAQAIVEASSNRERLLLMADRARTLAVKKYSLTAIQSKYKSLVESVV